MMTSIPMNANPANLPENFGHLNDHRLRKSLGARARKTPETCTWDTVADKNEKLYCQVVEKKKGILSFRS